MSATLQALKAKSDALVQEEKRRISKRREIVLLIQQFLMDQGFLNSLEALQEESGFSLSTHEIADNVDLPLVYQHFLEYYEMRFGKPPKVLRKTAQDESSTKRNRAASSTSNNNKTTPPKSEAPAAGKQETNPKPIPSTNSESTPQDGEAGSSLSGMDIRGSGFAAVRQGNSAEDERTRKILKPLSSFLNGYNSETKELAMIISRDIFTENPNVQWEDVIGLDGAKRLLKEAVVMPLMYPDLFTGGLISPWRGVLLYGPPGTGKTMLAKAVATECHTTFFNISASSIVSKYRGDSEKLIRVLFELARYHAPSTIFLDEIDSIMGQRGNGPGEHEASRRMKTELLIQMDGLSRSEDATVFILAASNLPWELDAALLRRLEKRVLVRLPDLPGRKSVFESQLPPNDPRTSEIDYEYLAENTDGYSCADVCLVCKEAAMYPMRRLMANMETAKLASKAKNIAHDTRLNIKLDPVTQEDCVKALEVTKASSGNKLEAKYLDWQQQFGAY